MTTNDFQDIYLTVADIEPIVNELARLQEQRDPETLKFIQNIHQWILDHERTSPFMEKILLQIQNNKNLLEVLETIPYKHIFKLLRDSNQLERVSILDLINENHFQKGLLDCFDKIKIGSNFQTRKKIIEEAFSLYKLEFYAGCLCLILSQLEGIITDYLLYKNIIEESPNEETSQINLKKTNCTGKSCRISGLADKITLATKVNKNFNRLEAFTFDNNANIKFSNERNNILHGSNINNFNRERCFIVFIWIDSILKTIYKSEVN